MRSLPQMTSEVTIKGLTYHVEPIPPGEDGTHAFRLTSPKDKVYDVIRERDGILRCDCPHYEARLRDNTRTPCKHGQSLIDAGLLPAPGADPLYVPPTGHCEGCSRNVMAADLLVGYCPACRAELRSFDPAAAPEPVTCKRCGLDVLTIEEGYCSACWPEINTGTADDAPAESPEPWADFEPLQPADDEVPFADGDWSEFDIWTLGPPPPLTSEPSPAEAPPGLTLLEWVTHQIRHYELMGTSLGWMVAGTLRKLAAEVRATGAANPAQLEERLEVLASGHEDELGRLERAEDVLSRIEAAINARERR
jgi:hypothetical protein